MKAKKLKRYYIKCTVWEYYEVWAFTRKEALETNTEDPYFVNYRNKKILRKEEQYGS